MLRSSDDIRWRFFKGDGFPNVWKENVLKTDFRVWLKRDWIHGLEGVPLAEKVEYEISACYERIVEGAAVEDLWEGVCWFAHRGESDRINRLKLPKRVYEDWEVLTNQKSGDPSLFSYFWDCKEIWASFYGAYRIDLYGENLHWWAFLTLMDGLGPDTPLARLLGKRKPAKGASKEETLTAKFAAIPE